MSKPFLKQVLCYPTWNTRIDNTFIQFVLYKIPLCRTSSIFTPAGCASLSFLSFFLTIIRTIFRRLIYPPTVGARLAAVKCRPILHLCVDVFFGRLEFYCLQLTMDFRSFARGSQWCGILYYHWWTTYKTGAAMFPGEVLFFTLLYNYFFISMDVMLKTNTAEPYFRILTTLPTPN